MNAQPRRTHLLSLKFYLFFLLTLYPPSCSHRFEQQTCSFLDHSGVIINAYNSPEVIINFFSLWCLSSAT